MKQFVKYYICFGFQLLTKTRLRELVKEVDPNEQLEEDVEDLMLQISDDFVDELVRAACVFAKHRKSNIVEVKDVQLYLGNYKNNYRTINLSFYPLK